MAQTTWVMLLPIVTIVLALLTKEIYMSLLIGIFTGAMLYTGFSVFDSVITMFDVMAANVGDNANLLIFLIILGIQVAVPGHMTRFIVPALDHHHAAGV